MILPDAETISYINMFFHLFISNLLICKFLLKDGGDSKSIDLTEKQAIRLFVLLSLDMLVNVIWGIYRFFSDV